MDRIFESLNGFTQFSTVLISLIALAFHLRWSRRATALGPTILTTLGIFFCFAGIAWGLVDFDPRDVRSSVPHLLQGIRTSFWSSVVGIFWALTLKIRVAVFGDAAVPASGAQEGSTVDDLARLLVQLNRSICGAEDAALSSQLRLLRADGNERLDRLTEAFARYAENIAEVNSKALVRALTEVVRDFNVRLHEQFGDNFKRLDSGVERLVAWQVQYEKQLQALIGQETATRENMADAASRLSDIVNKASEFAAVAQSLQGIVRTVNNQSEQLARSLMLLSDLVREVAEGLPVVEERILEMIAQDGKRARPNRETPEGDDGPTSRRPAKPVQATRA
jgi:methyl-accepting chemotaxis protein